MLVAPDIGPSFTRFLAIIRLVKGSGRATGLAETIRDLNAFVFLYNGAGLAAYNN